MSTADVVAWIFALPAVTVFFLAYGIVEDIIRKRCTPRKITEPREPAPTTSIVDPPRNADPPLEIRGYDTPELFRQDALAHIRHLESEVAEHERNIQTILTEIRKRGAA